MKHLALLLPLLLLASCAYTPTTRSQTSIDHKSIDQVTVSNGGRISSADRTDLSPTHNPGDVVVVMDVYTLTVPLGGISKNSEFWKKVDEDHVDITTHDLMLRNGLRYGTAPNEEWPKFFQKILDDLRATSQKGTWAPSPSSSNELPINSGIDYQDLFYVDRAGQIKGRVYQHCDNLLTVDFEPIPHRPQDTRIQIAAVVRDRQFAYTVTAMNQTVAVDRVRPEVLYDLNLVAEVPFDHFLVIAPSEVDLPFNLGSTFMIHPGKAGQVETVLVLVPKPMRLGAPLPAPAPAAPLQNLKK